MVWKGWSADEERWIMGISRRMVCKGYEKEIVQKRIKGILLAKPLGHIYEFWKFQFWSCPLFWGITSEISWLVGG